MAENESRLAELKEVISDKDLEHLLGTIRDIRYGSVTLTIQDGKAVQIEKNEKIRIR